METRCHRFTEWTFHGDLMLQMNEHPQRFVCYFIKLTMMSVQELSELTTEWRRRLKRKGD